MTRKTRQRLEQTTKWAVSFAWKKSDRKLRRQASVVRTFWREEKEDDLKSARNLWWEERERIQDMSRRNHSDFQEEEVLKGKSRQKKEETKIDTKVNLLRLLNYWCLTGHQKGLHSWLLSHLQYQEWVSWYPYSKGGGGDRKDKRLCRICLLHV